MTPQLYGNAIIVFDWRSNLLPFGLLAIFSLFLMLIAADLMLLSSNYDWKAGTIVAVSFGAALLAAAGAVSQFSAFCLVIISLFAAAMLLGRSIFVRSRKQIFVCLSAAAVSAFVAATFADETLFFWNHSSLARHVSGQVTEFSPTTWDEKTGQLSVAGVHFAYLRGTLSPAYQRDDARHPVFKNGDLVRISYLEYADNPYARRILRVERLR